MDVLLSSISHPKGYILTYPLRVRFDHFYRKKNTLPVNQAFLEQNIRTMGYRLEREEQVIITTTSLKKPEERVLIFVS
jgi:hypothetical protein